MFTKSVFTDIRRSPWKLGQPANVRRILLSAAGPVAASVA